MDDASRAQLRLALKSAKTPRGYRVFDSEINRNGSCLIFIETPFGRASIVVAPGSDHVDRFLKLLREFGMSRENSKKNGTGKNQNKKRAEVAME